MKYLFEKKQLDSLLKQASGDDKNIVSWLYPKHGNAKQTSQNNLYGLIWNPINPKLQGVKTVYFSPSGLLNNISFVALITPDSIYLSDKYNLVQLGSTREIAKLKLRKDYITQSDSAIVFGGINYNQMDVPVDTSKNDIVDYTRGPSLPTDSNTRSIPWRNLKKTFKETNFVDSLFRKNKLTTAYYTGSKATETVFKEMSGKAPQIIHIATHGFFFPEPEGKHDKDIFADLGQQTYRFSDNPLLRSGLILAGGNYVWTGGEQTPSKDDGILTSYEVSNMDLFKTKLAVLSACQTGLGDIKGNEGVFGLQRAFKMAGVDYIIMSLWQVQGKETTQFMQLFYTNCFEKQTIGEAFNNAQAKMRKKNEAYYGAAFVLME